MKSGIVILLMTLYCCSAKAQEPAWEWRNPSPCGAPLYACTAVDDSTVAIAGSHGTILISSDHGATWSIRVNTPDTLDYLTAITSPDAHTILAAGLRSLIRSTDRGTHWDPYYSEFAYVALASNRNGLLAATNSGGVLYLSFDAGRTWESRMVPGVPSSRRIVACAPDGLLVIAASTGEILVSEDFSQSWTEHLPSQAFTQPRSVIADQDLILLLANDRVYRSMDRGMNWESFTAGAGLQCLERPGGSVLLAAGNGGVIRRSTDLGEHWSTVDSASGFPILGICSTDTAHVFAVGSAGLIIRSSDGGRSWHNGFRSHRADMNDLFFQSPEIGYAVDGTGAILRCTDGGSTWETLHNADDILFAINFCDESTGLAAGDRGAILRTTDAGESWAALQSLTPNTLWDIAWLSRTEAVVTSCCGSFFRTSDGGDSWETLTIAPKQRYYAVSFPDPDFGVAAGTEGAIVISRDRGKSWTELPSGSNADLHAIACIERGNIVAAGAGGLILRSSDEGLSWTMEAQLGSDVWDIRFLDKRRGFCVGVSGLLAWTTDGGVSWHRQAPLTDLAFFCADAPSSRDVYAGGRAGAVLRGLFDVTNSAVSPPVLPRSVQLHSLYPSPANEQVSVRYSVNECSSIRLRIYDASGRVVAGYGPVQRPPGTHVEELLLQSLPAGMYRLMLDANGIIDVLPLPLLR